MKLVLTVTKMTVEGDDVVYKFDSELQSPLLGNEISGELYWKAKVDNAQFVLGDQLEYDLTEEEEVVV